MVNGKVCVFLTNVLCKSGKLLIIILETHFMMLWYKKRLVLTVDCQLSATVSSRWWWTKIYFITWLNIQHSVGAHSWWGPEERCYHKIFQCSLSAVSGAWCDLLLLPESESLHLVCGFQTFGRYQFKFFRNLYQQPIRNLASIFSNPNPTFFLDERDAIQKKTFTKWVNKHLKKVSI